jgi:hypothetical protein
MRFTRTAIVIAAVLGFWALTSGDRAYALVVSEQMNQVNNGNVIADPAQIIDVSGNNGLGPAWRVTVGGGLHFEEFFFNYDQPLQAGDVVLTGSSVGGWSAVTGGGTAGNFGQFSFKWDGPVSGGLAELSFDILAAGNFLPNSTEALFAAKIASQQGGNAGGFVSSVAVSEVPLPAAVWLFLTAVLGLTGCARIRQKGGTVVAP